MTDTVQFRPFVLSSIGTLHDDAADVLDSLQTCAVRRGFARDCAARMKVALLQFEVTRLGALAVRKDAGRLEVVDGDVEVEGFD